MNDKERFGRYEIIRKLGGGMTDVYLARDPQLNRAVVLKTIEKSSDESTRLAIEAEGRGARIQRQLSKHERILELYEWGEENGCFFVVMEYFAGRTLAEILRAEGRLAAKRAAAYAAEICNQLLLLHAFAINEEGETAAVVHGDIKPSNIQIGKDDQLRILDFGIAKFITADRELTQHQLGSTSYCSPERLRDSQVDVHADLWAVGVTLYEMLAGGPPFSAHDTGRLERLIRSGEQPAELPTDCPIELKAVVAKCLDGNIGRRYKSAAALEADLVEFVGKGTTAAARERWYRKASTTIFGGSQLDRPAQLKAVSQPADRKRRAPPKHEKANVAIALLAGLLAGLLLFLPVTSYLRMREITRTLAQRKDYLLLPPAVLAADWQSYQTVKHGALWWRGFFSPEDLEERFRANLIDSANNLIGRFRRSSDNRLDNFDWARARLCLLYSLELDPLNERARSQLNLCDGYLSLERTPGPDVVFSIRAFRRASGLLPRSPDSHLGLARAYIYGVRNVGLGLAQLHEAEQLGYRLGPREMEQKGDGYLLRAETELNRARRTPVETMPAAAKWLRLAEDDMSRAQKLYEPIAGFGEVDENLNRLYADQADQAKLEEAVSLQALPKPHFVLLKARFVKRASFYRWR